MNTFIALGGGNDIGGSCYFIGLGRSSIMLDAGARYTQDNVMRFPDLSPLYSLGLEGLHDLDALIISHAHIDHTGALPAFAKYLDGVNIYSSIPTPEMLFIQHTGSEFRRDTANMSERFITLPYGIAHEVRNFRITLYPAGHIPGAAMTLIESDGGRVLYTGDFCGFDQLTLKGAEFPNLKIDTLICETTFGYTSLNIRPDIRQLAMKVNAILRHTDTFGYNARISGRAAEFTASILECMRLGLIPEMNIWLDNDSWESCRLSEKWGDSRIFGQHTRHLKDYHGSGGVIVSGRPLYGLEEPDYKFFNHADCDDILKLISVTRPDKIIFIHGIPMNNTARNILSEVHERFGTSIESVHALNGQDIELLRSDE